MLLTFFKITAFFIPLFSFILGFVTIFKNPKSRVSQLWFLTCMAVGAWGLGLFALLFVKSDSSALICNYILYTGVTLVPIFFYHFVSEFLFRTKKDRVFIFIGYIVATIFLIIVFNPPLLISGVSARNGFRHWVDAGAFYIPFLVYFWIYVVGSIILLIKGFKKNDGIIKRQIFFILLAAFIGFIGGGTNFLPQTVGIYPFGNFITFLYPVIITYGIFLPTLRIKI